MLSSRTYWDCPLASANERCGLVIGDRHGEGARPAGAPHKCDKIIARPGLGYDQDQLSSKLQTSPVHAGDAWRRCSNGDAEVKLDEVLGEIRGMRRAASRACDHELRRALLEARSEFDHRPRQ